MKTSQIGRNLTLAVIFGVLGWSAVRALGMRTPATLWKPSAHCYHAHPPRWEYPAGAWVLKVDCQGKLDIKGKKWRINRSLAGEWVQVVRMEERMLVFYCTTLIRELDPRLNSSPPA